jgi:hypothetical protein
MDWSRVSASGQGSGMSAGAGGNGTGVPGDVRQPLPAQQAGGECRREGISGPDGVRHFYRDAWLIVQAVPVEQQRAIFPAGERDEIEGIQFPQSG